MRIRTKIVLSELILVVGFLLSLVVFLIISFSLNNQISMQVKSMDVLAALNKINQEISSLLNDEGSILIHENNILLHALSFSANSDELAGLGRRQVFKVQEIEQFQDILSKGNEINAHIDSFTAQHLEGFSDKNIQRFSEEYLALKTNLDLLQTRIAHFSADFVNGNTILQQAIDENILMFRNISLITTFIALGTAVVVMIMFSTKLISRISMVKDAISQVAKGDFSVNLSIMSKDELESLSKNYNYFKEQFGIKLTSLLGLMTAVMSKLEENPDITQVTSTIASSVFENINASGVGVYLIDGDRKLLKPSSFAGNFLPPFPLPPFVQSSEDNVKVFMSEYAVPLGEGDFGTAVREAKPTFIRSVRNMYEGTCDFVRSIDDPLYIESSLITPLVYNDQILGVITAVNDLTGGAFTDLEFIHMQTFADYAALTVVNTLNIGDLIEKKVIHRELEVAADIQKKLIPKKFPMMQTLKLAVTSRSKQDICSDFYDIFQVEKGKMFVVLCDVAGKGIPVSLYMVMIRTIIRILANPSRTPAQMLTFLNRSIGNRISVDQFASIIILVYDENARKVQYSSASNIPAIIYRAESRSIQRIDQKGLPLGVKKNESYRDSIFSISSGDILALTTDGIPDTLMKGNKVYTMNKLEDTVKHNSASLPNEIIHCVFDDLDKETDKEKQQDDQTLIVLKAV